MDWETSHRPSNAPFFKSSARIHSRYALPQSADLYRFWFKIYAKRMSADVYRFLSADRVKLILWRRSGCLLWFKEELFDSTAETAVVSMCSPVLPWLLARPVFHKQLYCKARQNDCVIKGVISGDVVQLCMGWNWRYLHASRWPSGPIAAARVWLGLRQPGKHRIWAGTRIAEEWIIWSIRRRLHRKTLQY